MLMALSNPKPYNLLEAKLAWAQNCVITDHNSENQTGPWLLLAFCANVAHLEGNETWIQTVGRTWRGNVRWCSLYSQKRENCASEVVVIDRIQRGIDENVLCRVGIWGPAAWECSSAFI